MFAFFLLLMGPVFGDYAFDVCDDQSCHAEQLNLLQLRNGRGADVLGLEPDSDDVDASEKESRLGSGLKKEITLMLPSQKITLRSYFREVILINIFLTMFDCFGNVRLIFHKKNFSLTSPPSKLAHGRAQRGKFFNISIGFS